MRQQLVNASDRTRDIPRDGTPLTAVAVCVVEGPDDGARVTCSGERPLCIGTAAVNELQLRDETVSRYHLEVSPHADGVKLRDLGSLNGTYAGGIRLETAIVPAGTRLRIGQTVLQLEPAGASVS